MPHVLAVNLKVADYETWKECFDASVQQRKGKGEVSCQLFRKADDPNELVMLAEWQDEESLRQFLGSEELRHAQQESGVTQIPDCLVLQEIENVQL